MLFAGITWMLVRKLVYSANMVPGPGFLKHASLFLLVIGENQSQRWAQSCLLEWSRTAKVETACNSNTLAMSKPV